MLARNYGSVVPSRVVSVYDGDTFFIDVDRWPGVIGQRIGVRLRGIDTPELRGACETEKRQARAAQRMTEARLRHADSVVLTALERGKYFRLIANVWVDGESLAQTLIDNGLARIYDGTRRRPWC